MKWSKMSADGNTNNSRYVKEVDTTYSYACETALYEDIMTVRSNAFTFGRDIQGKIERWGSTGGMCGGSIYNAWVVYHGGWVDLGWFDFNDALDEKERKVNPFTLKELKSFVEKQHTLVNKTV